MPASSPAHLITRQQASDGVICLTLTGEFDLDTAGELASAIARAAETQDATKIDVDLAETTFIDSATVGVLTLGYHLAASTGCQLRVLNACGLAREVLEITGVLGLLTGSSTPEHLA